VDGKQRQTDAIVHPCGRKITFTLPPDQHHCSDEAKWRLGGGKKVDTVFVHLILHTTQNVDMI